VKKVLKILPEQFLLKRTPSLGFFQKKIFYTDSIYKANPMEGIKQEIQA